MQRKTLGSGSLWLPVRRGDIFCSPACGNKCTWAKYQRACNIAFKMQRALENEFGKWTSRVTENLGWFASAARAGLTVYATTDHGKRVTYTTLFNSNGENFMGGEADFLVTRTEVFYDPVKAVTAQIDAIRDRVAKLNQQIRSVNSAYLTLCGNGI